MPVVPDAARFPENFGSPAAPSPRPVAAAPMEMPTSSRGGSHALWWIVGVVALLLAGSVFSLASLRKTRTEDADLAAAAKQLEPSVGLVVLVIKTDQGPRSLPRASAWACGEHTFATNGHVAKEVQEALDKGASAVIVTNRHPELRYTIVKVSMHPKFGQPLNHPDGKDPAVPAFDVALLEVKEQVAHVAPIAPADELQRIDSGYRVAMLGFPMEGLVGGGVDINNPVATMQSGIITSSTDYWLAQADFPQRLLLQHNLAATGGSSGSPIFNTRGQVVGILSAGNVVGQVDFSSGQMGRTPSGVMINFAQRVDLLQEVPAP